MPDNDNTNPPTVVNNSDAVKIKKHELISWAMRTSSSLTKNEFRVLIAIIQRYNVHTGECWPSQTRIAEDIGMSNPTETGRRKVCAAIGSLKRKGAITTSKGRFSSLSYDLGVTGIGDTHVTGIGDTHVTGIGDTHVTGIGDTHVTGIGDTHVTGIGDTNSEVNSEEKDEKNDEAHSVFDDFDPAEESHPTDPDTESESDQKPEVDPPPGSKPEAAPTDPQPEPIPKPSAQPGQQTLALSGIEDEPKPKPKPKSDPEVEEWIKAYVAEFSCSSPRGRADLARVKREIKLRGIKECLGILSRWAEFLREPPPTWNGGGARDRSITRIFNPKLISWAEETVDDDEGVDIIAATKAILSDEEFYQQNAARASEWLTDFMVEDLEIDPSKMPPEDSILFQLDPIGVSVVNGLVFPRSSIPLIDAKLRLIAAHRYALIKIPLEETDARSYCRSAIKYASNSFIVEVTKRSFLSAMRERRNALLERKRKEKEKEKMRQATIENEGAIQ